ncbi:MAG: HlyC/CorC family transporter [bacterium]|nr:HlyC/CorC family transporter [bacterium]
MVVLYIIGFIVLIFFSAFFSSAETSLLSLNKIKLNLKAKRKKKKAVLLKRILKDPEEFFSTILIGNNFVNVAAASISTLLFTRLLTANEEVILLVSTAATTIIILVFAEILPKSYAFRYSERLSNFYAYPIRFFSYLFYPFVKVTALLSNIIFRNKAAHDKKDLSVEEIKHFLSSEINLFRYNPESLRMVNEVLDIAEKDIKSIMTPRLNIIALKETASVDELMTIILGKKRSKIPIYHDTLDNITGIVHTRKLIPMLMTNEFKDLNLTDIAAKPIFISEYSSINYALKEFKKHGLNIAVILDEYGSTIGVLTINDIFSEILGEIRIGGHSIRRSGENRFIVYAGLPVDEINANLNCHLPEKKDYTTLSGLFIYHFGKIPGENSKIEIGDIQLTVKRMGKRKIEEILLTIRGE